VSLELLPSESDGDDDDDEEEEDDDSLSEDEDGGDWSRFRRFFAPCDADLLVVAGVDATSAVTASGGIGARDIAANSILLIKGLYLN